MIKNKILLLSDADGTLFDSFPLYNKAIDIALKNEGFTGRQYESYFKEFNDFYEIIPGTSWYQIFYLLLSFHGYKDTPVQPVLELFYKAARQLIFKESKSLLLTTSKPILSTVKKNKGKVVIHTGTSRPLLDALVEATEIKKWIDWSICGDEVCGKKGYEKHKQHMLEKAIERYPGYVPLVMGDTKADIWAANSLGIPSILIYRGYPKDPSVLDYTIMYDYNETSTKKEEELVNWILAGDY